MLRLLALSFLFCAFLGSTQAQETITLNSLDGLELTADLYLVSGDVDTPFIVLFHQANASRGEYAEIAPKLNELGFNALALDQCSGNSAGGIDNESAAKAKEAGLATDFLDAEQDLEAALVYVNETYESATVVGLGSSYSASLILKLAAEKPALLDAVMAFSPGEYFGSSDFIESSVSTLELPVLITSSKFEADDWEAIFTAIPSTNKVGFIPDEGFGQHGSASLRKSVSKSELYWQAVEAFLKTL